MPEYLFDIETLTTVAKAIVLLLGGLITLLARRAAVRTGSDSLRLFSIGFAIITVGTFFGGAVSRILRYDLQVGVLVESLLTAIGFVLLAYSLYATGPDASEPDDRRPP